MRTFLFFVLYTSILLLPACTSTEELLQKGRYDEAFSRCFSRLHRETRHKFETVIALESAYNRAQARDRFLVDQVITDSAGADWEAAFRLLEKMRKRQEQVQSLMPLRASDGYLARLVMRPDIDSLANYTRQAAGMELYRQAEPLMADARLGNKAAARDAWGLLEKIRKRYTPLEVDWQGMQQEAIALGTVNFLLKTDFPGVLPGIEGELSRQWARFFRVPPGDVVIDYVVMCRNLSITVGFDNKSVSTQTVSKEVEDGYEEVRDSSGKVVSRSAKMKTVTAEITTVELSKSADGSLMVDVVDNRTGRRVGAQYITGSYQFNDSYTTVSGDSRAAPCTSSGISIDNFPSNFAMEDHVMDDLIFSLKHYLWGYME